MRLYYLACMIINAYGMQENTVKPPSELINSFDQLEADLRQALHDACTNPTHQSMKRFMACYGKTDQALREASHLILDQSLPTDPAPKHFSN